MSSVHKIKFNAIGYISIYVQSNDDPMVMYMSMYMAMYMYINSLWFDVFHSVSE